MNLNLPQPFEKQVKDFVIAHNLNLEEFAVSAFQEKMKVEDDIPLSHKQEIRRRLQAHKNDDFQAEMIAKDTIDDSDKTIPHSHLKEINRRLHAYENGEVGTYDLEEFKARAYNHLERIKHNESV